MTFLKTIYADLVEKRLWPVAVLLLVALIAVPLLLGRGGGGDDAPITADVPPAAAIADAGGRSPDDAARRAEIGVETAPATPTVRPGPVHDPFAGNRPATTPASGGAGTVAPGSSSRTSTPPASGGEPAAPSRASAPASASSSGDGASASSGAGTPSPASTGTTPAASSAPTTTTTPAPAAVPAARRTVSVTLGVAPEAGARLERRPGSLRLAPLPSAADPVVLFLGMLQEDAAAVFMLPDGATAHGEGTCVPRPGDCQALELPVGGEEYLDVPTATGSRELRLTVPQAGVTTWTRVRQADVARGRVSKAGLQLVRAAIQRQDPALSYYRFSKRSGLLLRTKPGTDG